MTSSASGPQVNYTLIVPRVCYTGPVNVAVDIGRAAATRGWRVHLLYLSGSVERTDLDQFAEVRKFRLSDFVTLKGVVHTHCLRPDLLGWLLSRNPYCRLITTFHNFFLEDVGFDYPRWKISLAWRLWRRAVARFDHRVCISETMRRYYEKLLPHMSFDVVYNFRAPAPPAGPVPHHVAAWLWQQRSSDRIVGAFVGNLIKRKNLQKLVSSVLSNEEVALVICGTGPLETEIKDMISQSDGGDRVLLAGYTDRPETILQQVDLLVLPSHTEGFPLVVLEAARAGRPALLSNIEVHRELAGLGFGQTFNHLEFSDFAAKARELVSDSGQRERVKTLWKTRFTPDVGFAKYAALAYVSDILQQGPKGDIQA